MTALNDVLDKYRSHPDFLGTDLVSADQRGAVDDTPLHIAARAGAIADMIVLVENGATVNLPGDLGNTPLHYAALTGMLEAAAKLMELGADPEIENEFGENPAVVAEQGGHHQVGRLIRRRLRHR
jgi:ankyrin repeat protein